MNERISILTGVNEINGICIDLARRSDVKKIGVLSKNLVEIGMPGWIWNPQKVSSQIDDPDSLVLVGRKESEPIAFVIAEFKKPVANLLLLGVSVSCQRTGIGSRLVKIVEQSAVALGFASIQLEVRSGNEEARAFYKRLGYKEIRVLHQYYRNRESAVKMAHRLSYQPVLFSE